jgi:hypothetical protein
MLAHNPEFPHIYLGENTARQAEQAHVLVMPNTEAAQAIFQAAQAHGLPAPAELADTAIILNWRGYELPSVVDPSFQDAPDSYRYFPSQCLTSSTKAEVADHYRHILELPVHNWVAPFLGYQLIQAVMRSAEGARDEHSEDGRLAELAKRAVLLGQAVLHRPVKILHTRV